MVRKTADASEDEYKKLLKQGQKLSFPVGNYITASNSVKIALDGCETYFGEEDAKFAVMNVVKKPIDWYFLVKTFGSRMIADCGWGETAYALPELLKGQLGSISASSANYLTSNLAILQEYLKKNRNNTLINNKKKQNEKKYNLDRNSISVINRWWNFLLVEK